MRAEWYTFYHMSRRLGLMVLMALWGGGLARLGGVGVGGGRVVGLGGVGGGVGGPGGGHWTSLRRWGRPDR